MKNLIYKELKLSIHPICYIFALLFPLMAFIPNYPLFVGLLYVATSYPILFLGANKGQQSNDLLYTTLLPVRKKDIVLARFIAVSLLIAMAFLVTIAISPFAEDVHQILIESNPEEWGEMEYVGLGFPALFSLFGLSLICYSIYNAIFFHFFYKNGKGIFLATLIGLLTFMILLSLTTLALPLAIPAFYSFSSTLLGNVIIGCSGLIIYIVFGFLTYKHASKELEDVDL